MRACLTAVLLVITAEAVMAGSLEEAKTAYDKGDFRRAERIYSELSNQGDRIAQLQLGLMYDEGYGIPKQNQQAVRWFSVASYRLSEINNVMVMCKQNNLLSLARCR